jgi:CBS domain-containing protein
MCSQAAEALLAGNGQRVAVMSERDDIVGIVTPCGILRAVHSRMHELGSILDVEIGALFDVTSGGMLTVHQDATIRKGFSLLIARGVSSAPIVDDAGALVGTLAFHQLRVIAEYKAGAASRLFDSQSVLWLATKDAAGKRSAGGEVVVQHSLAMSGFDTLSTLMCTLSVTRAHRVWICDNNAAPIGVVTIKQM